MANWIGPAHAKMEKKGTVGSFGKATPSKIARAKKEGGKEEKKAVFAENMKKIAEKRKGKKKKSSSSRSERPLTYFGQHMSEDNF